MKVIFATLCVGWLVVVTTRADVVTIVEPSQKMPEGKTVVWSPLFQATWDAMNVKFGGKPTKIEPANELMTSLDNFTWEPEKVMPEGNWKTWAGPATEEFLNQVNEDAAKMTGEEKGPFILKAPSPTSIACFGLMNREVEFEKEFHQSKINPLEFRAGKNNINVQFFGVRGRSTGSYGNSVRILSHSEKSHALEISCKAVDEKVVLYLPSEPEDFSVALEKIRTMRKVFDDEASKSVYKFQTSPMLNDVDDVRIPYISLSASEDLAGQLSGMRFYSNSGVPWRIMRAEQKTEFELFEKGAKVRVEVSIEAAPFGGPPPLPPTPREFFYDRPFFIFMWRDKAELPYLGVWVADDSVLKKF